MSLSEDPRAWLPEQWQQWCREVGEPTYRARQVFEWLHKHQVHNAEAMTSLPLTLRERLHETLGDDPWHLETEQQSDDGTRKLLLRSQHTEDAIESVLLPERLMAGADDPPWAQRVKDTDNVSQCISTQVGCAMGCVFCASGAMGLQRNLEASEIIAQVYYGKRRLLEGEHLRRLVLMGMGEPLHNYEATAQAMKVLTHPWGWGLGARRITVSTSGLVPQIDQLAHDFGGAVHLAVSVHAADNDTRTQILPINRRYPLEALRACLLRYPLRRRRWFTIEYTLMRGINDSLADARALVKWVRGMPVKINLIPMNPVSHIDLEAPSLERVEAFQQVFLDARLPVYVRKQRGDDIDAACGQLATRAATRRGKRPGQSLPVV